MSDPKPKAVPPAPDPCLVRLVGTWGNPSEKSWREARNCPHGCGKTCKGLR